MDQDISARDVNAMKQIDDLMDEEIKVRCHDRCPWGIRHIFYILSVIFGLLVWILVIIPFLLIQIFVVCTWYHCCCQCGGNKPKHGARYDVSPFKCCCCGYCCLPYIGDCKLSHLETAPAKRGVCWTLWGKYLEFIGLVQWIISREKGAREYNMQGLRFRNRYGDIYPHISGLGVCDYNMAKEMLHSGVHPRNQTFLTMPLNDTFKRVGKEMPLFYATGSKKHREGRDLIQIFLCHSKAKIHDKALIVRIQSSVRTSQTLATVSRQEIGIMVATVLFKLFLNSGFEINTREREAVNDLYDPGKGVKGLVLPNWLGFTCGGWKAERDFLSHFMTIRRAFIRGKDSKQMIEFVHYCNEHELDVSTALNTLTSGFILAALLGAITPIWFGINKFREDPGKYGKLYRNNKIAFIKESVRYIGLNPGVTSYVLPKDIKLKVANKQRTFYKGTNVLIQIGHCNRDIDIFGGDDKTFEYADTFDPTRENLDKILSWNGLEEHVTAQNEKAAPRHCPGHDMALFVAILILDMFQPDEKEANI